jgi:hypothetical protein
MFNKKFRVSITLMNSPYFISLNNSNEYNLLIATTAIRFVYKCQNVYSTAVTTTCKKKPLVFFFL